MKKLLLLLCVALLPQFSFYLLADGNNEKVDLPIPLHQSTDVKHERSINLIEAFYNDGCNTIRISAHSDMGEIFVAVTNLVNGNYSASWFDSSVMTDTIMLLDSTYGIYELVLTTEYGEIYTGTFCVD